jgi:hypothetical protein
LTLFILLSRLEIRWLVFLLLYHLWLYHNQHAELSGILQWPTQVTPLLAKLVSSYRRVTLAWLHSAQGDRALRQEAITEMVVAPPACLGHCHTIIHLSGLH